MALRTEFVVPPYDFLRLGHAIVIKTSIPSAAAECWGRDRFQIHMTIKISADDPTTLALIGRRIPAGLPGVEYALDRVIGQGAMATAFYAHRIAPSGVSPVVIKIVSPDLVLDAAPTALLMVTKEAVALGRLNERVPPTPFVVRLVEVGDVKISQGGQEFALPWIAIEYVHGGAEGTTLSERVERSIEATAFAFDHSRAILAIECLSGGLEAIHEVGVIHRDIKPENILCCGYGTDEIFKIADFGIARPVGIAATFGGVPVGTAGYAPPEQIVNPDEAGPASDVFALAATTYYLLTGQEYFLVSDPMAGVEAAYKPERRSILECGTLDREIRARPDVVAEIDAILAEATHADFRKRPARPSEFSSRLISALDVDRSTLLPPSSTRLDTLFQGKTPTVPSGWDWSIRHKPAGERVIRSVSWDGDSSCLAATDRGLEFWNGTEWVIAPTEGLPGEPSFVHRVAPGAWLVGGAQGTFVEYSQEGVGRVVRGPDPSVRFVLASGDPANVLVAVGEKDGEIPALYTLADGKWLPTARMTKAASITSLSRWDAERWLVAGRSTKGQGFAAIYSPIKMKVERIPTPEARAYLSCAGRPERGTGLVVGSEGRTVRLSDDGERHASIVDGEPDLSASAVDIFGNGWAGSTGKVWTQLGTSTRVWRCVWSERAWKVPTVSIFADIGLVVAMTADGGIVEGRSEEPGDSVP